MATMIEIEDMITVGALADKLSLPVAKIITELMKPCFPFGLKKLPNSKNIHQQV